MPRYATLQELVRDGAELEIRCPKCYHSERADPSSALNYVAARRRLNQLGDRAAEPDFTIERCVIGVPCPICGVDNLKVDVARPHRTSDD